MDPHVEAASLADSILASLEQPVAREDVTSVRSVIIACILFESPAPDLKVAVHSVGSYYNITVNGYRNVVDLVRWVNQFLGNNRSISMSNVTHTYLQMTDTTYFIVLQVQKTEMHQGRQSMIQQIESSRASSRPVRSSGRPIQMVKRTE